MRGERRLPPRPPDENRRRRSRNQRADGTHASSAPRESSCRAPFPTREEGQEDLVERLVAPAQDMLDVGLSGRAADVREPACQHLEIALAHVAPVRLHLASVLHGEEEGRVLEGELELVRIEDVEERHLVLAPPELDELLENVVLAVEEIGED